jgi:hypothetical protein
VCQNCAQQLNGSIDEQIALKKKEKKRRKKEEERK